MLCRVDRHCFDVGSTCVAEPPDCLECDTYSMPMQSMKAVLSVAPWPLHCGPRLVVRGTQRNTPAAHFCARAQTAPQHWGGDICKRGSCCHAKARSCLQGSCVGWPLCEHIPRQSAPRIIGSGRYCDYCQSGLRLQLRRCWQAVLGASKGHAHEQAPQVFDDCVPTTPGYNGGAARAWERGQSWAHHRRQIFYKRVLAGREHNQRIHLNI